MINASEVASKMQSKREVSMDHDLGITVDSYRFTDFWVLKWVFICPKLNRWPSSIWEIWPWAKGPGLSARRCRSCRCLILKGWPYQPCWTTWKATRQCYERYPVSRGKLIDCPEPIWPMWYTRSWANPSRPGWSSRWHWGIKRWPWKEPRW